MPELLEVEAYRRALLPLLGHEVLEVTADAMVCAHPASSTCPLIGRRLTGLTRHGKHLIIDADGLEVGLHFGMTGSLIVNGSPVFDRLEFGSTIQSGPHVRLRLTMTDGAVVELHDPRRMARATLLADLGALGPDAATINLDELASALGSGSHSVVALKARLLDQHRIAGLGNLLVDDVCYRGGLDPRRPAAGLNRAELERLARAISETLVELAARGGSHRGDLQPERHRGGRCPRCGVELVRAQVGSRTTYLCPLHQR